MGNEAAAMAQGAEQSGEIIHYAATEIAPGIVINMQTMYMTWIAMAIVFVLFFVVSRNPKLVPSGLQNVMEMVIDFLDGMMNQNLGEKGRKYMASFIITLFMFILISNEIGMLPQIFFFFYSGGWGFILNGGAPAVFGYFHSGVSCVPLSV